MSEASTAEVGMDGGKTKGSQRPLWVKWVALEPKDPRRAQWLAEIRRGAGKAACTVPRMWPYYRRFDIGPRQLVSRELVAEHICLVLFGFHQQSTDVPMHVNRQALAEALCELRGRERFRDRESALDSKVFATATSTSMSELQLHLRTLVSLLHAEDIGLDYSALFDDLVSWQRPGGPDRIRQRWGRAYYRRRSATTEPSTTTSPRTKGQSS